MLSYNCQLRVPLAIMSKSYTSKPFQDPFQSAIIRNEHKFKIPIQISTKKLTDVHVSDRNGKTELENKNLPHGLMPERMPNHVAVNIDGKRRWALERGLPVLFGYRCIGPKTKMLANLCADYGIKVCTVCWLPSTNLLRHKVETGFVFSVFEEILETDLEEYSRRDMKITVIGKRSNLPESLQRSIKLAEETTEHNTGLHLLLAINYGGREDITQAAKGIATKINQGLLLPEDIYDRIVSMEMNTNCCGEFADPDFIIKTGGETSVSNFFLWQSSYAELYFVEKHFPDFEEPDFVAALKSFQGRQRRFGAHAY